MNSQDIIRETYDSDLKAQKTSLISASTIYAVVNTGAVGNTNALATLLSGPNQIGSVTISNQLDIRSLNSSSTIFAVVNTSASGDPKTFIGLVTSVIASSPTIYAVVNTGASSGNVTLSDSKGYIGLTTTTLGIGTQKIGLVTLNASDAWIGLVTAALNAGTATIGIVRMASPMTIGASANYIGLVTTTPGSEYASPSIIQGMVSGASGAVMQLGNNAVSWCLVKAHPGNPTTVYVGPSLASVNVSFPLDPGETTGYSVNNTNLLYMCAVGTSQLRFTGGL